MFASRRKSSTNSSSLDIDSRVAAEVARTGAQQAHAPIRRSNHQARTRDQVGIASDAPGLMLGLLGPVMLTGEAGQTKTAQFAQRVILAMLALSPNRVVSIPALVDAIWQEEAESRRIKNLHFHISRIRAILRELEPVRATPRLIAQPPGYRLVINAGERDLDVFRHQIGKAREAAQSRPHQAATLYEQAMSLWRGPALGDVRDANHWLGAESARLDELYLSGLEESLAADLVVKPADQVVADLVSLVAQHPRRERPRGQLMIALYRCGREAEALQTFASYRARLAEDLGLEPGPELQRIHQQVLVQSRDLAPSPTVRASESAQPQLAPRQLPADVADFTGRVREVAEIRGFLSRRDESAAPRIVVITGPPGIGKTALALHVAQAMRSSFPDGQLYVPLAINSEVQPSPSDVLADVLIGLGVSERSLPATLEQRAALYRARLADKRVIVVADGAVSAGQVRLLVPGTAGCGVLATGQLRPAGLPGARVLRVGPLNRAESVELLRKVAGRGRIEAEPNEALALVERCGGFPLAIRIVGMRLASRPSWPVAALAGQTEGHPPVLERLILGDHVLRGSLDSSFQRLDPSARQVFLGLAQMRDPEVCVAAAAILLNEPREGVERAMEQLVDAGFLEAAEPESYRMHGLLRAYALERRAVERPGRPIVGCAIAERA